MANEIQVDYGSGNMLYAVIRDATGQVWHVAGQELETWGDGGHTTSDYDIPLTDSGGSHYVGSFDGNVSTGSYFVQVFRQLGANPSDTDPLVCGRQILWTGSGELTATKILANKAVQDKVTGEIDYYDDDGATILFTLTPWDTRTIIARAPSL